MYHSQWEQDRFLNEVIFKGKRDGVFIDVGAHDGVTINNTLFFERELGWSGLCIEPIHERYLELKANRSAICINACVYKQDTLVPFTRNLGHTEMLSGITSSYDKRHLQRMSFEQSIYGGTTVETMIQAFSLSTLFERYQISHVDLLTIDTEGSELDILMGIDWKVSIDVIVIEDNYPDTFEKIDRLLTKANYIQAQKLGGDWVYVSRRIINS